MKRRDFIKAAGATAFTLFLPAIGCDGPGSRSTREVRVETTSRFLFFSATGEVLELRPWDHVLHVRDGNGTLVSTIGGLGSAPGRLNAPAALATDADSIFVADRGNHRVQVFDGSGAMVRAFGEFGPSEGQFAYPAGIAFDATRGRLLVADTGNHRVQIFSPEGALLKRVGSQGTRLGEFQAPRAIAFGVDGTLHVADVGNSRVQILDAETYAPIAAYGQRSTGPTDRSGPAMLRPESLAIAPEGTVYVGDPTGAALVVFDQAGSFVERRPLTLDGLPAAPLHLAMDPNGVLHVTAQAAANVAA